MGLVAHVAAASRRLGAAALATATLASGGVYPVTFPSTNLRIRVEFLIGGTWVDVTRYVLYREGITISRGKRADQRKATPATCKLVLRNDDRRFSPRNPTGPYFGQLGRNVKMRVVVNPGSGDALRFTGRIPSWPQQLTSSPNERTVAIVAAGQRRRLERGRSALRSAHYRAVTRADPPPLAYWPAEDGRYATSLASGLPGGVAMALTGEVNLGSAGGPPGSAPLPDFSSGGSAVGAVPTDSFSTSWRVEFAARFDVMKSGDFSAALDIETGGTVSLWDLTAAIADEGGLFVQRVNADGSTAADASDFQVDDRSWHWIQLDASQSGSDIAWTLYVDQAAVLSGTVSSATLGAVRRIIVNPTGDPDEGVPAIGHIAVWSPITTAPDTYDSINGHAGETATGRFARICAEEGIPYVLAELDPETQTMGPQLTTGAIDLLVECEEVAEGVIDEDLDDQLRLASRTYRWNRELAMTVDASAGECQAIDPTDDDETARNVWTITRRNGVTATYTRETGALNINEPEDDPLGIGRVEDSAVLSLATDEQAGQHAAYRVGRDTIDEVRYPQLRVNLVKSPHLIPAWLGCDIHSRFAITNVPSEIGASASGLVIEGYTELITHKFWEIDLYLTPARISEPALWNSLNAFYDCRGSTLASDLDTTDTTVDLNITDECAWAHDYGDYEVVIDGEEMTVTAVGAVSGTYPSRTQTLTVTRSVNGAVASHAAGAEVHVRDYGIYAL